MPDNNFRTSRQVAINLMANTLAPRCWNFSGRYCPPDAACTYPLHCVLVNLDKPNAVNNPEKQPVLIQLGDMLFCAVCVKATDMTIKLWQCQLTTDSRGDKTIWRCGNAACGYEYT